MTKLMKIFDIQIGTSQGKTSPLLSKTMGIIVPDN